MSEMFALRVQWSADPEITVSDEVNDAHSVKYLILDFDAVSDLDSTGIFVFTKLPRLCKEQGIVMIFTDMLPGVRSKLIDKYQVVPENHYMEQTGRRGGVLRGASIGMGVGCAEPVVQGARDAAGLQKPHDQQSDGGVNAL